MRLGAVAERARECNGRARVGASARAHQMSSWRQDSGGGGGEDIGRVEAAEGAADGGRLGRHARAVLELPADEHEGAPVSMGVRPGQQGRGLEREFGGCGVPIWAPKSRVRAPTQITVMRAACQAARMTAPAFSGFECALGRTPPNDREPTERERRAKRGGRAR